MNGKKEEIVKMKKQSILVLAVMILAAVFTAFIISASESGVGADKAIENDKDIPILLKSRQFVPTPGMEAGLERSMSEQAAIGIQRSHVLIQFDHIPDASERKNRLFGNSREINLHDKSSK